MKRTALGIAGFMVLAIAAEAATFRVEYVVQDTNNIPVLAAEAGYQTHLQNQNGDWLENPEAPAEFLRKQFEKHCKGYPIGLYNSVVSRNKQNEAKQATNAFTTLVDQGLTVTYE